jgi:hypothetical protein
MSFVNDLLDPVVIDIFSPGADVSSAQGACGNFFSDRLATVSTDFHKILLVGGCGDLSRYLFKYAIIMPCFWSFF